jgi:hypothetical protein
MKHIFVPRPLELVQDDKMTLKLYPVVNLTMKPPECTHAFQKIKTALVAPGIGCRVMINTLGAKLNLSAIINNILGNRNCNFYCNWCNFSSLMILPFHNNGGTQVNDTTTAHDSMILLPVVNGPTTACWKQHICFVCIQVNMDF